MFYSVWYYVLFCVIFLKIDFIYVIFCVILCFFCVIFLRIDFQYVLFCVILCFILCNIFENRLHICFILCDILRFILCNIFEKRFHICFFCVILLSDAIFQKGFKWLMLHKFPSTFSKLPPKMKIHTNINQYIPI